MGAVNGNCSHWKVSRLRRLASEMYKSSRKLIRAELDAVMKSIKNLPYEMRTQFNNRLRKLIANADNVDKLFIKYSSKMIM